MLMCVLLHFRSHFGPPVDLVPLAARKSKQYVLSLEPYLAQTSWIFFTVRPIPCCQAPSNPENLLIITITTLASLWYSAILQYIGCFHILFISEKVQRGGFVLLNTVFFEFFCQTPSVTM